MLHFSLFFFSLLLLSFSFSLLVSFVRLLQFKNKTETNRIIANQSLLSITTLLTMPKIKNVLCIATAKTFSLVFTRGYSALLCRQPYPTSRRVVLETLFLEL